MGHGACAREWLGGRGAVRVWPGGSVVAPRLVGVLVAPLPVDEHRSAAGLMPSD